MTELSPDNLAGDLRNSLVQQMKDMRTAFNDLSEAEQKAEIDNLERISLQLVEQVIDIVTEDGSTQLNISVHKVGINKETIEAKVSIDRDEEFAELLTKGAHKPAKISFAANREGFMRVGDRPAADPDQPAMFTDEVEGSNVQKLERPQPSSAPMGETGNDKPAKPARQRKPRTAAKKAGGGAKKTLQLA